MSALVIATGVKSQKIVDGHRIDVVPFVGVNKEEAFSMLGVGFTTENGDEMWGPVMPHVLIQSWRAMKILEQMPEIRHNTLSSCWYAARGTFHCSDRHNHQLAAQFPDHQQFDTLVSEILETIPTDKELEGMLTILRTEGIQVESYELADLIREHELAPNSLAHRIVEEEEASCLRNKERELIIQEPIAPSNSLVSFFGDLGINNFIMGCGIGNYGLDWCHIGLEDLDTNAKEDCLDLYKYSNLQHTTQGPETTSESIGPGAIMSTTSFGKIEQPWYVAPNGSRYTFIDVVFYEGTFLIMTKIEKEGCYPTEKQYSISQLREMINQE